jgi:hypothetical protein
LHRSVFLGNTEFMHTETYFSDQVLNRVKAFIGFICLIVPLIACDVSQTYGEVETPFIFEVAVGEQHSWTIHVKPDVMYEISIRSIDGENANPQGSFYIYDDEHINSCPTCISSIKGYIEDGLILRVIPNRETLDLMFIPGRNSNRAQCVLEVKEISREEAKTNKDH